MRPNLFNFATSELSQDALLCWLLSWASVDNRESDPELQLVGEAVMALIYQRAKRIPPAAYSSVKVLRQYYNIDILCLVNCETALLIEDKVGTTQHSGQLPRYKDELCIRHPNYDVIPVYIQTGDQCDYSEVLKHGYQVIQRKDLLAILESEIGKSARARSDILDDYANHLRDIEDRVQSFLTLPAEQWSNASWKGFYTRLQLSLQQGRWKYVANQSGGFMGFWWYANEFPDYKIYLQLQNS